MVMCPARGSALIACGDQRDSNRFAASAASSTCPASLAASGAAPANTPPYGQHRLDTAAAAAARQLALDRRPVTAQPLRYRPGTQPRLCHRLDHHTLAETQTLRHTQNPHRIGCRLVQPANHGRHVATTDGVRRPSSVRFVYSTDSGGLPRSTADSPRPHTTLKREEPVKPSQWFSGAYSPTVYALQIWQDDSLPCKCSPIPYRWSGEHYRRSSDSWNE